MSEFFSYLQLLGVMLFAILILMSVLAGLIVPAALSVRGRFWESHLTAGLSGALALASLGLVFLLIHPADWILPLFMLVAAGLVLAVSVLVGRAFR